MNALRTVTVAAFALLVAGCAGGAPDQAATSAPAKDQSSTSTTTTSAPSQDEPASSTASDWAIPLREPTVGGPCTGTVTMTLPGDYAIIDGQLLSQEMRVQASCDSHLRYSDFAPGIEWTPTAIAEVMQGDHCPTGTDVTISGLPARMCSGMEEDGSYGWTAVFVVVSSDYVVDIGVDYAGEPPVVVEDVFATARLDVQTS